MFNNTAQSPYFSIFPKKTSTSQLTGGTPAASATTASTAGGGTTAQPSGGLFGFLNKVGQTINQVGTPGYDPSKIWSSPASAQNNGNASTKTGAKTDLLAPHQTSTQGNQASPQPVVAQSATTNPPASTSSTGSTASTQGIPGAFQNLFNTQANTKPYTAVTNAATASQANATGQNQTPAQQVNQGNIQQGAQTSADISQNQTPAVTNAENQYNSLAKNSPILQAEVAGNPNIAAEVASGRGQALGNQLAGQLQGAAQNVTNTLQGQGQQVTAANNQGNLGVSGQSNQNTAASNAGSIANTAQGNQIGAQQNAASNLLNSLTQQGYVIINKTTGQPLSNEGAMSAAFTGGATGQSENIGAQTQTYTAAQQQARNLTGQLSQVISSYNINPNDVNALNGLAQKWAANTSNPQYATFNNLINDISNSYAQVLTPTGGNVTDYKTKIAQSFIDSSMKGQGILQVLQTMDDQASAKIAANKQIGTGQSPTPTNSNPISLGSEW